MTSTLKFGKSQQSRTAGLAHILMFSMCGILTSATLMVGFNGDVIGFVFAWFFGWLSAAILAGTLFGNPNVSGYTLIASVILTLLIIGGYLVWEIVPWIWEVPSGHLDICTPGPYDEESDVRNCVLLFANVYIVWKVIETVVFLFLLYLCGWSVTGIAHDSIFIQG
jgi:hypothetical protein